MHYCCFLYACKFLIGLLWLSAASLAAPQVAPAAAVAGASEQLNAAHQASIRAQSHAINTVKQATASIDHQSFEQALQNAIRAHAAFIEQLRQAQGSVRTSGGGSGALRTGSFASVDRRGGVAAASVSASSSSLKVTK